MEVRKLVKTDRLIHASKVIQGLSACMDDMRPDEAGEWLMSRIQDSSAPLYSFPPGAQFAVELTPEMAETVWRDTPRRNLTRDTHLAISIDDLMGVLGYALPEGMALKRVACDGEEATPQQALHKAGNVTPLPTPTGRAHVSRELTLLNQAAQRFWANADPDEPQTHPDNPTVASWLSERGMTKSLAERAASIIRPPWAHVGRKPEA